MVYGYNRKVAKYRKPFHLNIGVIVFLIMLLYIIIQSFIYLNKEHLAFYEVLEKSIADDITCRGIAIRKEKVVYSNAEGYLNYYLKDGEKTAKNAVVYTIDTDGSIHNLLSNGESPITMEAEQIVELRSQIANFRNVFKNYNYNEVANFKYDVENLLLELNSNSISGKLDSVLSSKIKNSVGVNVGKSDSSGIVSYSIDKMENLTAEQITQKMFQNTKYTRQQLRTRDLIKSGEPAFKLVTDENWSVVIALTKEQFEKLKDKTQIKITFLKDGLTTWAPLELYQKDNTNFARLDLDKYMVRYINDRYLNIEILLNSAVGLKIPKTAILKKEFYKVPIEFFTKGSSSETGILKEVYNKKGDKSFEFVATDLYYKDKTYGYIDTKDIEAGAQIRSVDTNKTFTVSETGSLEGVYNVNKGYGVFRRIEKIYENEEYCIIKDNTEYGLSVYDHIILDSKLAKDQEII